VPECLQCHHDDLREQHVPVGDPVADTVSALLHVDITVENVEHRYHPVACGSEQVRIGGAIFPGICIIRDGEEVTLCESHLHFENSVDLQGFHFLMCIVKLSESFLQHYYLLSEPVGVVLL